MSIILNDERLMVPGDKACFKSETALVVTVIGVMIYGQGNVTYDCGWLCNGEYKRAEIRAFELEAT